jgi:putative tryptophan/tyrosine transport system substrate-binding protein
MRRREFITLLGSAAATWPLAVRAQQPMLVIGFLNPASAGPWTHLVAAFRGGLGELGYVEGQNVAIEFRWADGQYDQLPAMAAELVRRKVAVLVSTGGVAPVLAAKAATSTIPIVFTVGTDPVKLGVVASLNRPGGNATGVNLFTAVVDTKRLGLLHDLVPVATSIAAIVNPNNPPAESQTKSIQEAAHAVGWQAHMLRASTERELDAAFARLAQLHAGAVMVAADPFFLSRRDYIVALAARHAIPAIYEQREYAAAGGLASYGADFRDSYRQAGIYTGRILKGEKPADLPVMQSTKFEFVINLKTAKSLGLVVPNSMQLLADEVIE